MSVNEQSLDECRKREIYIEDKAGNDDYKIFKPGNVCSDKITSYPVFPGIDLLYSDFHSYQYAEKAADTNKDLVIIHYCCEGRIEWELENGIFHYLGEGDLSVHTTKTQMTNTHFPLEHYHGIAVIIDLDKMKPMEPMLHSLGVFMTELSEKACRDKHFFISRADDTIKHIFSELYTIPDEIRLNYCKIKVLELLLFLSILDMQYGHKKSTYFKKSDIVKMKRIKEYLIHHIDEHITLHALSKEFELPLTFMKSCFKMVYGMPIYTFVRSYRLQMGAHLLKKTPESVTNIAMKVGYSNISKFSAAFRDEMGVTPVEYRKKMNGI